MSACPAHPMQRGCVCGEHTPALRRVPEARTLSPMRFGTLTWLVLLLVACDPAPGPVVSVHLLPEDFTTAFPIPPRDDGWSADFLTLRVVASHPDAGMERPRGGMLRLVELTTEREVAGEMRVGYVDVRGEPRSPPGYEGGSAISFVPSNELTEGWYVLVADLRGIGRELYPIGGVLEGELLYARVHVGPRPTWHATFLQQERGETSLFVIVPEAIADLSVPAPSVTFTADEAPMSCRPSDFPHPRFSFSCPLRPRGTRWGVHLASDSIRTPEGAPEGSVEIVQTEIAESGGGHDAALTSPRFGIDVANRVLGL